MSYPVSSSRALPHTFAFIYLDLVQTRVIQNDGQSKKIVKWSVENWSKYQD